MRPGVPVALALSLLLLPALTGCLRGVIVGGCPDVDFAWVDVEAMGGGALERVTLTAVGHLPPEAFEDDIAEVRTPPCVTAQPRYELAAEDGAVRGARVAQQAYDEVWLRFSDGVTRAFTDLTIAGNGTLTVSLRGGSVALAWNGAALDARPVERFDDPRALDGFQYALWPPRELNESRRVIPFPVNSTHTHGVAVTTHIDMPREWRRPPPGWKPAGWVNLTLVAPNGTAVERSHVYPGAPEPPNHSGEPFGLYHPISATGEWRVVVETSPGRDDSGDVVPASYSLEVQLHY